MRAALLAVLVVLAAGCRGGAGTRCDRVCRAESDCAERLEMPDVDRASCVEACGELERDPRLSMLVDQHVRCVSLARDCPELLECP